MSANKKFIVWDWNGTLLDDTDAVLVALNAVLTKSDHAPMSMETFRAISTTQRHKFYCDAGVSKEKVALVLETERAIFHDTYEPLANDVLLHQGAKDVLQQLRTNNVSNLIVSNHISDKIIKLLHKHDVHPYFDEIIAYACRNTQFKDVTKGDKLRQHMEANKLSGANALIIGDTTEEIQIARDSGMISVAITGGVHSETRLRDMKPDYVIHALTELGPILQEREFVA